MSSNDKLATPLEMASRVSDAFNSLNKKGYLVENPNINMQVTREINLSTSAI